MPSIPSTPPAKPQGTPQSGTPGSWTHPKYEEILRRKENSTFTEIQFKQLLRNVGALIFSFFGLHTIFASNLVRAILPSPHSLGIVYTIAHWTLIAARLLFFFNILQALAPFFLTPDEITDIPLTPSQRNVLGLSPSPAPVSAASQQDASMYITPPRYNKNKASPSTSRSATPAAPLTPGSPTRSTIGIGKTRVTSKGSPIAPGTALIQSQYSSVGSSASGFDISMSALRSPSPVKGGGFGFSESERRHSFGSPSPKNMGLNQSSLAASMQSNANPSVSVGAKWLFEQKNKRRSEYL